jgi:hypothetical protein
VTSVDVIAERSRRRRRYRGLEDEIPAADANQFFSDTHAVAISWLRINLSGVSLRNFFRRLLVQALATVDGEDVRRCVQLTFFND